MRALNTTESWGWVARLLHWAIASLILFQLGMGVYMSEFVTDTFRQFNLTQIHKSWGSVVFALAFVRVFWRLINRNAPAMRAGTPAWQERIASLTHLALYVLMFVLPLSGWIMSAASPNQDLLNIDNMVFDWFALPDPWVPGDRSVASLASVVHEYCAWGLAGLLAVHSGAALKHHFIDGDTVLRRMTFGA